MLAQVVDRKTVERAVAARLVETGKLEESDRPVAGSQ